MSLISIISTLKLTTSKYLWSKQEIFPYVFLLINRKLWDPTFKLLLDVLFPNCLASQCLETFTVFEGNRWCPPLFSFYSFFILTNTCKNIFFSIALCPLWGLSWLILFHLQATVVSPWLHVGFVVSWKFYHVGAFSAFIMFSWQYWCPHK